MDMMTILEFIAIFAFGWWAGQIYMLLKFRKNLKKIVEDAGMTMDEWAETVNDLTIKAVKVPNLFTEQSGNSIMLYSKDTGAFVCQASSIDELAMLANEYNKINVAIVKHDDNEIYFIDGKVRNSLQ